MSTATLPSDQQSDPEFSSILPQKGWITAKQLARHFGVKPDAIKAWLNQYGIPYKKPGDTVIIWLETFYERLPDVEPGAKKKGS